MALFLICKELYSLYFFTIPYDEKIFRRKRVWLVVIQQNILSSFVLELIEDLLSSQAERDVDRHGRLEASHAVLGDLLDVPPHAQPKGRGERSEDQASSQIGSDEPIVDQLLGRCASVDAPVAVEAEASSRVRTELRHGGDGEPRVEHVVALVHGETAADAASGPNQPRLAHIVLEETRRHHGVEGASDEEADGSGTSAERRLALDAFRLGHVDRPRLLDVDLNARVVVHLDRLGILEDRVAGIDLDHLDFDAVDGVGLDDGLVAVRERLVAAREQQGEAHESQGDTTQREVEHLGSLLAFLAIAGCVGYTPTWKTACGTAISNLINKIFY